MTTHELILLLQDCDDNATIVVEIPLDAKQGDQIRISGVDKDNNDFVILLA